MINKQKTVKVRACAVVLSVLITLTAMTVFGCEKGRGGGDNATVTVTFIAEGEETSSSVIKGERVEEPEAPIKPSDAGHTYSFYGWYTDGGDRYDFNTVVTQDMTLTARFYATARKFEVKYIDESGAASVEVAYGTKAERPDDPVKPSDAGYMYSFDGWYTSGGERYDFDSVVTENITLTARFTKTARLYTVKFVCDGAITEKSYEYGAKVAEPTAPEKPDGEKTEYAFLGWFTASGERYEFGAAVVGDIELFARYSATDKPKVTFVNNGETVSTVYVKRGTTVARPQDPTKPSSAEFGYVFEFWSDGNGAYDFASAVTEDLTLIAEYKESRRRYTVTFEVNGEEYYSTTVEYGGTAALPSEPSGAGGEEFIGWFDGETEWTANSIAERDTTLVARFGQVYIFEENADGYTVTGVRKPIPSGIAEIPVAYNGRAVTAIGDSAFLGATWLKRLVLPSGLREIGEYAFGDCAGLGSVEFNAGILHIGSGAFMHCGLKEVTLPDSVATVGGLAFSDCYELTEVRISATAEEIGEFAFTDCGDGLTIYFGGDEAMWQSIARTDYEMFGVTLVYGIE